MTQFRPTFNLSDTDIQNVDMDGTNNASESLKSQKVFKLWQQKSEYRFQMYSQFQGRQQQANALSDILRTVFLIQLKGVEVKFYLPLNLASFNIFSPIF